jgi:hypothetical protein
MDDTAVRRKALHDLFHSLTTGIAKHCPDVSADIQRMQSSTTYFRQMLELAISTGEPELVAIARELRSRGVMLAPLVTIPSPDVNPRRVNPDIEQTRVMDGLRRAPAGGGELLQQPLAQKVSSRTLMVACLVVSLTSLALWWGLKTPVETVSGDLRGKVVWTSDRFWQLEDIVYALPGATLVIEPGTTVLAKAGSALIITRGATLEARGSAARPIVFTSARPEGERGRGDWGGVVLMGSAPVNQRATHLEGIAETDTRGHFGGRNPTGSCGALQYVRIEFAGRETYPDRELNGLTLAGCGSATVIDHLQVHKSLDDAVEIFGGSVSMRNVLITDPGDDGLDYDLGWRGQIQYLAIKMYPGIGDNAIEGDNNARYPVMSPASSPVIYNAALIGTGKTDERHRAMSLRSGTEAVFGNLAMAGFSSGAIMLEGDETLENVLDGKIMFHHAILDAEGETSSSAFAIVHDTPGTKDGKATTRAAPSAIQPRRVATDEEILGHLLNSGRIAVASSGLSGSAFSLVSPGFASSGEAVEGAELPAGEFWDRRAHFIGAAERGDDAYWWAGWTAFPEH